MGLPYSKVHRSAGLRILPRVPKMINVESSVQFVAAHRASASDLGPFWAGSILESASQLVRREGRGIGPAAEDDCGRAVAPAAVPRYCGAAIWGYFLITGMRLEIELKH